MRTVRETLVQSVVALALAPFHLLLSLLAPGTRLAGPSHVLLGIWGQPPGIVAEVLVVLVEVAIVIIALGAVAVGLLSLPLWLLMWKKERSMSALTPEPAPSVR